MRRPRRRLKHYTVISLSDGTILAAYPSRKPNPRIMKRDGMTVDADGVVSEVVYPGSDLSDPSNEKRTRFQDVITNRLNARRAVRELAVEPIDALRRDISGLREEVRCLAAALEHLTGVPVQSAHGSQ